MASPPKRERVECPPSFKCPVQQEVMIDPVCSVDGHTFERSAIEQWLITHDTSPLTGLKLDSRTLVPNVALRNAIEEFFGGFGAQLANKIEYNDLELENEIMVGPTKTVYEGAWRGKRVAVMKVKGGCDAESGMLARLSKHPSLLRFYGKATGEGHDFLVTEFAPQGSMADVLEKVERLTQTLTMGVMMAVAHQVCEGMEAISAESLIHRNLAIRNVLCFALDPADPSLTDVKVADFGLTKSGQTFYGGDGGEVPVRWMSPEAYRERRWSEKSDVWSFGVLLWELFSYGEFPYSKLDTDDEVKDFIDKGGRLKKPMNCPSQIYKVMEVCWQKRPDDRPTFRSLRIQLREADRDQAVELAMQNARHSLPSRHSSGQVGGRTIEEQYKASNARLAEKHSPEQLQTRVEDEIANMNANLDQSRVQEDGARQLANFAGSALGRVHIAKMGGIEALVEAMKAHPQVKVVQECAVAALSNLSASNGENQAKIAEKGGIVVLINAMRDHETKALVQQYGATALRNLTLHNAENKKMIADIGGIAALITAMKNHADHSSVQQYAADALQNIALHNAENKIKIRVDGGIPVLIDAMRNHPQEARVQQYACFALANLSANNAENAECIAKAGAIDQIIAAMNTHRGKPGVQRYGASALKYLAGENSENQQQIANNNGIKSLVNAMTTHRTNDAVQQYAASALKNLAANNTENKTKIAVEGGIGVLLSAMRVHRMKALVQQHAASALQNLAGNHAENKTRIATENGIPLIVAAMINHPDKSQVQRYAASALKNLSSDNSENKLTIAREEGISALVAAIRAHVDEPEVQQYAAGALQNIAANNQYTKAEVVRFGGIEALKQSIEGRTARRGNAPDPVKESLESALRVIDH